MATLNTGDGQLQIEGSTLSIAVIDTGASAVILGRTFARKIDKCRAPHLSYGDFFITIGGNEEASVGRSTRPIEFILGKGTSEETKVNTKILIADTNSYDVTLGMDFLGLCFGFVDPLTKEFVWRVDCHDTENMPTRVARLPAICRGNKQARRGAYTIAVVTCGEDLMDATLGEEYDGEDFESQVRMDTHAEKTAPMLPCSSTQFSMLSKVKCTSLTQDLAERRRADALQRLKTAYKKELPVLEPRTRWTGEQFNGARPICTLESHLRDEDIEKRVCLPTIVAFPKSHAFRQHANGTPGEGQLWNTISKCWEEPTLEEKEQLMGYKVGSTDGGLATIPQRTKRLGQAMEGNTMRWLGAFLHAS